MRVPGPLSGGFLCYYRFFVLGVLRASLRSVLFLGMCVASTWVDEIEEEGGYSETFSSEAVFPGSLPGLPSSALPLRTRRLLH